MYILSIGNSFSHDSQKYLHKIGESAGADIFCANLFIGGCSLKTHWENFTGDLPEYDYEINGEFERKISISEALRDKNWDVITFQQASGDSGIYSTYEPYLSNLVNEVKKAVPSAKLYIHKTWAYDNGSAHPHFVRYGNNEKEMYRCICEAYSSASENTKLPIIPVGDVVQYCRDNLNEFNLNAGGITLTRDTFHLSYLYGRYLAGLVWFKVLCGGDVNKVTFVPEKDGEYSRKELLEIIKKAVVEVVK